MNRYSFFLRTLLFCSSSTLSIASDSVPLAGPIPVELLRNQTFLKAHPDLRWRVDAVGHYNAGRADRAIESFERAARYADKPSQAAIAELLWRGVGVGTDRELAYAWMDIAAERGYPRFLARREAMWQALDEHERTEALTLGAELMVQYGDHVAKPRMERTLRRAHRQLVGSRTGADVQGNRRFMNGFPVANKTRTSHAPSTMNDGDFTRVDSNSALDFFQSRYWHPETYWAAQDSVWLRQREGEVIVHPLIDDEP